MTRKQHTQLLADLKDLDCVMVDGSIKFLISTVGNQSIVRDAHNHGAIIPNSAITGRCIKCTANGVCAYLVAVDESESLVFAPFIGKEFYIVSNSNIKVGW